MQLKYTIIQKVKINLITLNKFPYIFKRLEQKYLLRFQNYLLEYISNIDVNLVNENFKFRIHFNKIYISNTRKKVFDLRFLTFFKKNIFWAFVLNYKQFSSNNIKSFKLYFKQTKIN